MSHLDASQVMLYNAEFSKLALCSPHILELEDFTQRCREGSTNQSGAEAEMQSMTKKDVVTEWSMRIELLRLWKLKRIQCSF